MTRVTPPVRTRTRATPVDEPLPAVVIDYLQEHHSGMYPTDTAPLLAFVRQCFSMRASRQHRHTILYRLKLQGMSVPRMAHLFGKSEMTIFRWLGEMRDWMAQQYTHQEVEEIHVERMSDLAAMQAELNKIFYADSKMSVGARISAGKAKIAVHAMHDQIMRQSSYYRAFDMGRQNTPDQDREARVNSNFVRDIEMIAAGGDPLSEFYAEDDDDSHQRQCDLAGLLGHLEALEDVREAQHLRPVDTS